LPPAHAHTVSELTLGLSAAQRPTIG
jgi:hypothetical protein